ncbi:MAG: hypothetical protein ACRDZZ_11335 [Ilumatobacteraceae bacterium]
MTRLASAGALAALALVVAGCATTVDPSIDAEPEVVATQAPVSPDTPLDDLIGELADEMRHLDEQVIDGDGDDQTLARIEELWLIAEPLARERDAELRFGLQKSVQLARTAVERRRPADASKGYKIVADLAAALG